MKHGHTGDVAIIGVGMNLPKANDFDTFWKVLCEETDCITNFPFKRKNKCEIFLSLLENDKKRGNYAPGAYLDSISQFDYEFFDIPKNVAIAITPKSRIMLETVWNAIEDSGYACTYNHWSNTAIYIGAFEEKNVYKNAVHEYYPELEYSNENIPDESVAQTIAKILKIRGIAADIDTACSSSLSTVHMGYQEIVGKKCDVAIVGGVSINALPFEYSGINIASSSYKTKTFDQFANGTVNGEGSIALILKSYDKAKEDLDHIYGVIKASAMNQDGKTIGITAPSLSAQIDVMEKAWKKAKINPEDILYIEAHGTGTQLGDPTECAALRKAFAKYTSRKQFCAIGSVKSNYGHLDAAAGILGLLKTIGVVYYGEIPATLHFQYPNKRISFVDSSIYVNSRLTKLYETEKLRLCGVNSFGLTGTNCHVVVSQHINSRSTSNQRKNKICYMTISAKNPEALTKLLDAYRNWDFSKSSIDEICYSANCKRVHYEYRIIFQVRSISDLRQKLESLYNDSISSEEIYVSRNVNIHTVYGGDDDICLRYIQGEKIDWLSIYGNEVYPSVSLPVYQYKREECWLYFSNKYPISSNVPMYQCVWRRSELQNVASTRDKTVVFGDGSKECQEFIQYMRVIHGDVVNVSIQGREGKFGDAMYGVYNSIDSIQRCLESIGNVKCYIVFITTDYNESIQGYESNLEHGIEESFHIIKAITSYTSDKIKIRFVMKKANKVKNDDEVTLYGAPLIGFLKVCRMEFLNLNIKCIDIDETMNNESLYNEVTAEECEFSVAYRNDSRYIEYLEKQMITEIKQKDNIILPDSVYIIAGGTGGIGRELCEFLAKKKNVTIIILSRHVEKSNFSYLNCKIHVYKIDITNEEDMNRVTGIIKEKYGRIQCIFQCASSRNSQLIKDLSYEEYKKNIHVKMKGTLLLKEMAELLPAKNMVLFSSVISLFGGVESSAYVTSNSFLDILPYSKSVVNIVTVNWPVWNNVGMDEHENNLHMKDLFLPLSKKKAIACMHELCCINKPRIVIGKLNHRLYKTLQYYVPIHIANESRIKEKSNDNPVYREEQDTKKVVIDILKQVLGYQTFSYEDNFFEIGGDSIFALKVINKIKEMINIKLDISDFFNAKNIGSLLNVIEEKKEKAKENHINIMNKAEKQDYYLVSPAQKRMFVLNYMTANNTAYTVTEASVIRGKLDSYKLESALNKVIERHEILRTTFHIKDGNVVQKIHPEYKMKINCVEVGVNDTNKIDEYVKSITRAFDLSKLPLFDVILIKIKEDEYIMPYIIHDILLDGKSRGILMYELGMQYKGIELPEMNYQYKDYAMWMNSLIENGEMMIQEQYWLEKYSNIPTLELPYDYPRPKEMAYEGEFIFNELSEAMYDRCKEYSKELSVSLFTLLISVYAIVLRRYSSTDDVVIGTVVEGRNDENLESIIGMFLNTLALRIHVPKDISFRTYLEAVKKTLTEDFSNSNYQFEDLVDKLKIKRSENRSPLFDVNFVLHNDYTNELQITLDDLEFSPYNVCNEVQNARFDLTIDVLEHKGGLRVYIYYDKNLFERATVNDIMICYITLLEKIVYHPDYTLEEYFNEIHNDVDKMNNIDPIMIDFEID